MASGSKVATGRVATVRVEVARTINLGDYENIKAHVGLDMPCSADRIDREYAKSLSWCKEKLAEAVEEILREAAEE